MAQHWPQSAMTTGAEVAPLPDPTFSILSTTSIPSTTCPNTTCLPSRWGVCPVQTKNCEPLVFGPAFAMERHPLPVCLPHLPWKVSSARVHHSIVSFQGSCVKVEISLKEVDVEVNPSMGASLQMRLSRANAASTLAKDAFPWQTQVQTPMDRSSSFALDRLP